MEKPWVSGPKELLLHGLDHLKINTDFDNRMAMICIDNSVELMIKTYLGLPQRITKIPIKKKDFDEIAQSFTRLIDALERHGQEKLTGIELGDIEVFHRTRNQLYHDGNGITVAKNYIEAYAQVAKILFENLFGFTVIDEIKPTSSLAELFIRKYAILERMLSQVLPQYSKGSAYPQMSTRDIQRAHEDGKIDSSAMNDLLKVKSFRNIFVHAKSNVTKEEMQLHLSIIESMIQRFSDVKDNELFARPITALPPKKLLKEIEISDTGIRFTSRKAFDLTISEAMALLMYAMDKPLRISEIARFLSTGWKKVSTNNVGAHFSHSRMKSIIVKTQQGYVLTGAGKDWVEDEVIPKLEK